MKDSGENWQICVVVYVVHTGSTSMIHRPITATVEFMFIFASVKDSQLDNKVFHFETIVMTIWIKYNS